jgi:hypothetical protein
MGSAKIALVGCCAIGAVALLSGSGMAAPKTTDPTQAIDAFEAVELEEALNGQQVKRKWPKATKRATRRRHPRARPAKRDELPDTDFPEWTRDQDLQDVMQDTLER